MDHLENPDHGTKLFGAPGGPARWRPHGPGPAIGGGPAGVVQPPNPGWQAGGTENLGAPVSSGPVIGGTIEPDPAPEWAPGRYDAPDPAPEWAPGRYKRPPQWQRRGLTSPPGAGSNNLGAPMGVVQPPNPGWQAGGTKDLGAPVGQWTDPTGLVNRRSPARPPQGTQQGAPPQRLGPPVKKPKTPKYTGSAYSKLPKGRNL